MYSGMGAWEEQMLSAMHTVLYIYLKFFHLLFLKLKLKLLG